MKPTRRSQFGKNDECDAPTGYVLARVSIGTQGALLSRLRSQKDWTACFVSMVWWWNDDDRPV